MKINGVELEDLDIFDLEVAEKYEKVLKNVEKEANKVNKDTSMTDAIKIQCNAVFDSFNALWGEGTDKKVFGNKVNLFTCINAFDELVTQVNESKDRVKKITEKYTPNRATRRAKK